MDCLSELSCSRLSAIRLIFSSDIPSRRTHWAATNSAPRAVVALGCCEKSRGRKFKGNKLHAHVPLMHCGASATGHGEWQPAAPSYLDTVDWRVSVGGREGGPLLPPAEREKARRHEAGRSTRPCREGVMNGGSIRHPYAIPARKLFFLVENGPQKQNLERNHGQSLLAGSRTPWLVGPWFLVFRDGVWPSWLPG